jgi:hypothetical protein
MRLSPSAACVAAASVCALAIPVASLLGPPGLVLFFLLGVSVFGLALFVLDVRGNKADVTAGREGAPLPRSAP